MVQIPTYDRRVISLGLGQLNVPKAKGAAFGAQVGEATQRLGHSIAAATSSLSDSLSSAMGRLNAQQEQQNALTGKLALSNWQADVADYANNAMRTTDPAQASTIPDAVSTYGEQRWQQQYASQVTGRYAPIADVHRQQFARSLQSQLTERATDMAVANTTTRIGAAADEQAARLANNPDYLPLAAQDMRRAIDEVNDATLPPWQKDHLKGEIAVKLYNGMMRGAVDRARANPLDQSALDAAAKAQAELPAAIPKMLGVTGKTPVPHASLTETSIAMPPKDLDARPGQLPRGPSNPAFFVARGGHPERNGGLNPVFAGRLQAAIAAAEAATGSKVQITSMRRTTAEQAEIYERSGHGKKFMAAPPGYSLHETGNATDLAEGPALRWIRAHHAELGLGILSERDPGHIQMPGVRAGGYPVAGGYRYRRAQPPPFVPGQKTIASAMGPKFLSANDHWGNEIDRIGQQRETLVTDLRSKITAELDDEDKRVKTGGERNPHINAETLGTVGYSPDEITAIEERRKTAATFYGVTKDWPNKSLGERQAAIEATQWGEGPVGKQARAQAEAYSQHIEVEHNRAAAALAGKAMAEIEDRAVAGTLTAEFVKGAAPYLWQRDRAVAERLLAGGGGASDAAALADLAKSVGVTPDLYRDVVRRYVAQERLAPDAATEWLARNGALHSGARKPADAAQERLQASFQPLSQEVEKVPEAGKVIEAAKAQMAEWLAKHPSADLFTANDAADAIAARHMPQMFAAVRAAKSFTPYHSGLGFLPTTLTQEQNNTARDAFDAQVMTGALSKDQIIAGEQVFRQWDELLAKQGAADAFVKQAPRQPPKPEEKPEAAQQSAPPMQPAPFRRWFADASKPVPFNEGTGEWEAVGRPNRDEVPGSSDEWPATPEEFKNKYGREPLTDTEVEFYFGREEEDENLDESGYDKPQPSAFGAEGEDVPRSLASVAESNDPLVNQIKGWAREYAVGQGYSPNFVDVVDQSKKVAVGRTEFDVAGLAFPDGGIMLFSGRLAGDKQLTEEVVAHELTHQKVFHYLKAKGFPRPAELLSAYNVARKKSASEVNEIEESEVIEEDENEVNAISQYADSFWNKVPRGPVFRAGVGPGAKRSVSELENVMHETLAEMAVGKLKRRDAEYGPEFERIYKEVNDAWNERRRKNENSFL